MTWTVYSRIDKTRWMNFVAMDDWVADPQTRRELTENPQVGIVVSVRLGPVGGFQLGVETESKLYTAAMEVIPASESAGTTPPRNTAPQLPPGVVG